MQNYIPFLTFTVIAAFTPGPNNCMALSHAVCSLRRGVFFSFGVFGGMLIVMSACGFLSGFLVKNLPQAELFMKMAGGSYMVWLAWGLWKSAGITEKPLHSSGKLIATGCFLQLINPKLIAYGVTAFSMFVLPSQPNVVMLAWYATILAVIGFAGTLTWALSGAFLNGFFQTYPLLINRTLAALVLWCGVSMFL